MIAFLSLVSATGILLSAYVIYQRAFSPLSSIPGPFSASLSKWWLIKHTLRGDFHRQIVNLHAEYGPVVRTGPTEISVVDPILVKKIYGAGSQFAKAKWYNTLQGGRHFDLFGEQDIHLHSSQRRLVSRAFAMETLKDLEPYVNAATSRFVAILQQQLSAAKSVNIDMGAWLQYFAFDVIGEVTFAQPFGFMEARKDDGIFARIQRSVASGVWLGHVPWILQLHNVLMPVFGNHLAINDREGFVRDYTKQQVEGRLARGSDRPDILGKLHSVHKEKPAELTIPNVISVCASNVGAGSDTTAISLRAILHFILLHPEKKRKLLAEVDSVASSRDDAVLTFGYQDAMKMPYLQASIYEALRLFPAIGMSLPRVVPVGGVMVQDRLIPEGTVMSANAWAVHRNPQVYGDNVEAYEPERWLGDRKAGMQGSFFTFGMGARTCIGKNISWMEMSKLVPTLLYHFEMELSDPTAALEEYCSLFVTQTGLNISLRPRIRNN